MNFVQIAADIISKNSLVMSFAVVAVMMVAGYRLSALLGEKRFGSAVAIVIGLVLALIAGKYTGGSKGIADIKILSGFGVLGGAMFRDYAIISTAFGANIEELKKAGVAGIVSLFVGVIFSFVVGAAFAIAFGFKSAVDVTTIGAGAVTFIVGPVTGGALGASSAVVALSIAAGVVKSVLCMIITPLVAPYIGLNNPQSAMVFGGLLGTTSGVAGGLAATDPKLVPYGAMTATFYTGLGCLLAPSVLFMIVRAILGS
ncbi:malonate transporter subunit MadM [Thermanaerosceptrum fracticalcis]|uniref:Malonate transporter subunit MadM n=1 Tax=Thermanaerosceptrum fracticalcis TaxID=1712410 RepID=A0A7G6DZB1_THEFR|nr:malonate transporter subunit MadM [Thermanaerosceptrum fracticalcis]QNB45165.1 malonate transporter subunit MadM [Thermanaerosceptrum fracticalcis]